MSSFIDYLDTNFSLEYVSSGNQVKIGGGSCPFCGEDRSDLRLYVNSETGLGQCFHCGEGFNPVKFVMKNEGCSYSKAIKILIGDDDAWSTGSSETVERVKETLRLPPMVRVLDCPPAAEYMLGRGVNGEAMEFFNVMFAVGDVEIGGKTYKTSNRVIIPIYDLSCKVISWQGRDITGKSSIRYLFPAGFEGAEYVFNAQAIPKNPKYLIICEGVFDAFGWWCAGFKNVVCTFGKKISEHQFDIIRYINPDIIFIAWDDDATINKYEFVEKYGHIYSIKIVNMGGKDADEMSVRELSNAISSSRTYDWSDKILSVM